MSEPVTVDAIWEAARLSFNGGNNRGGGIDFAGFAPAPVREQTCLILNTIGPDRDETLRGMLGHLGGCRFFAADGAELAAPDVLVRRDEFRLPVRARYAGDDGWRLADLREDPGDFHLFFVDLDPGVAARYGRQLLAGETWLQRRTKYGDLSDADLAAALDALEAGAGGPGPRHPSRFPGSAAAGPGTPRLAAFLTDVREEYFTVLGHIVDSRYYRTHAEPGAPEGKYSPKRRGYVVSMGQDLGAVKISGWTHTIPEYFDFDRFWAGYPGAVAQGGVEVTVQGRTAASPALHAYVWGMHHRYPTNSPAIDAEGRGNPAGAHPFKAYNVLLMHNGEQVGVDSTSPLLREFGYVHTDESMGEGATLYEGDSVYDRKALTDTEYAAYLVDFTRRVLGLSTEEASQVISPITGLDLEAMDEERRRLFELLSLNYIQLTPTGPYKFTIVESRPADGADGPAGGAAGPPAARRVGFRENMDIKFLRPHELVVSADTGPGGVRAIANGSEAKIADSMLRVLHDQGLLKDAGHDLRFNMRPGGNPGRGEFGGVVEAFLTPGAGDIELVNRFGEPVAVPRAGVKTDLGAAPDGSRVAADWRGSVRRGAGRDDRRAAGRRRRGERPLPRPGRRAAGRRRGSRRDRPRAPRDALGRRLPAPRRGRPARLRPAGRRRACHGPARAHRAAQAGRLLRPRRQGALGRGVRDRRRPSRRRLVRGRHLPPARRACRRCTRRCSAPRRVNSRSTRRPTRSAARGAPPATRKARRPRPQASGAASAFATRDDLVAPLDAAARRARRRPRRLRERGLRPDLRLDLPRRRRPSRLEEPRRLRLRRRAALSWRRTSPTPTALPPAASRSSSTAARSATSSAPCSRAPTYGSTDRGSATSA